MPIGELEFHHPWVLLLALPALALVVWSSRRRGATPAIRFPSVARLKGMPRTLRRRALVLVPLFQSLAVVLLVTALARPRTGDSRTVIRSEGIAIQMVLDRSGSMEEKMAYQGRQRKRIDIVKDVFARFAAGDDNLPGRRTDLIGLTTFARFTEESCPLVSQHEPLLTAVKNLRTVAPALDRYDQPIWDLRGIDRRRAQEMGLQQNPLNATAIGDGILRAVYSLVAAEEDLKQAGEVRTAAGEEAPGPAVLEVEEGYRIRGKVIILLTDGENNAGRDPAEAGKYARENGIRLYYILMREPFDRDPYFGRIVREYSRDQLLEVPRQVAGDPERAFLATDGNALADIYEKIDQLERTEIGRIEYRSYNERFHLFLVPALALAVLAMLLSETWLRRVP